MPKIIGNGAPTTQTPGVLGQEYFDKDSNTVYTCVKAEHKTDGADFDSDYEWAVIGGGSGAEEYVINVSETYNYDDDFRVVDKDKTFSDIKEAYDAGKKLVIHHTSYEREGVILYYNLAFFDAAAGPYSGNHGMFGFISGYTDGNNGAFRFYSITINAVNNLSCNILA